MVKRLGHGRGLVIVIVAAVFAVYTTHGVLRYVTFHAPAYDLGFFDQLTSNLSTGHNWSSSFVGYDFRGQHWEPVLLVWAQLYRLVQTPVWLIVITSAALALAPWAAWRLATAWLGDGHPGALVAALATALSPLVLRTAGFDYHSEALTPVLTLLALDAACRRRWLGVAACCALLVLLKEDAFLVVAGIGWIIFVAQRRRGGLLLSAGAVAGFIAVVGLYMPALRGGTSSDLLARYAYLGAGGHASTPLDVLGGLLANPGAWAGQLVGSSAIAGIGVALLPLALLPLLSGWSLLAPLPPLLLALLSSDSYQSSLQFHYGAEAFPLLLACALLGWRRLQGAFAQRPAPRRLRPLLTAAAVAAVLVAVPLTVSLDGRLADLGGIERVAAVDAVLSAVPPQASVSASTGLVAHLSDRTSITEFPTPGAPDWVVIDGRGAASEKAVAAGYDAAVAQLGRAYHEVAQGGGVTLWRRT